MPRETHELPSHRPAAPLGHAHLKGGATIALVPRSFTPGVLLVEARVGSGALVGTCTFERNADDSWTGSELYVESGWRRRGIATAIYDHVEKAGLKIAPSEHLDEEGALFWDARLAARNQTGPDRTP